jgi:hypothetical protein
MPVNSTNAATVVCPFLLLHAAAPFFSPHGSLNPDPSTVLPTSAQQGPTYKPMTQEPGNLRAANSHTDLQCHGPSVTISA